MDVPGEVGYRPVDTDTRVRRVVDENVYFEMTLRRYGKRGMTDTDETVRIV